MPSTTSTGAPSARALGRNPVDQQVGEVGQRVVLGVLRLHDRVDGEGARIGQHDAVAVGRGGGCGGGGDVSSCNGSVNSSSAAHGDAVGSFACTTTFFSMSSTPLH